MGNVSCFFIVIDQRFRLRFVNIDTIGHCFQIVICSLDQLAAAVVANAFFFRRDIDDMEACAACFADSSSCQSCDQFILSYSDVKNLVDLAAMGCKKFIQLLCLINGSRKTIQKESVLAVVLRQSVCRDLDDEIIRNELASVHVRLRFLAQLRTVFDVFSKDVSC